MDRPKNRIRSAATSKQCSITRFVKNIINLFFKHPLSGNEKPLNLELALKSSKVGTWSWDINADHVVWDKQTYELFQLSPDIKIIDYQASIKTIHPEDQQFVDSAVKEAIANKSEFDIVFRIYYPDKSIHYLGAKGKVYLNSSGDPNYLTGACWDMTEQRETELALKQAKETAEEASRLKSNFMAKISHDLRSPLNGIIGFAELMYHGKVGPVSIDHKEYLGDILSSARQLLLLINDVLDLSKVEAGKMEFHPENIDFVKILNETKDIFNTFITSKHIHFTTEINSDLCTAMIDPTRFKQVLYNYVSNALKCTDDNGEVKIYICNNDNNTFRLEVIDTGIGIHNEDLNKLFVEFQQLDHKVAKKYPSTGLGLALTKHIVEAQGGKVGVESTFGHGSKFFAILPYIQKDTSQHANGIG